MNWTDDQIHQINAWRRNIPGIHHESYRKNFDKALLGHSLRAAIKAKCLDCVCWEKNEVKKCTVVTCPLWLYRPYGKDKKARSVKSGAPAIAPESNGETNALFSGTGRVS